MLLLDCCFLFVGGVGSVCCLMLFVDVWCFLSAVRCLRCAVGGIAGCCVLCVVCKCLLLLLVVCCLLSAVVW